MPLRSAHQTLWKLLQVATCAFFCAFIYMERDACSMRCLIDQSVSPEKLPGFVKSRVFWVQFYTSEEWTKHACCHFARTGRPCTCMVQFTSYNNCDMVSSDEGSVLGFLGGMRWCVVYWCWLRKYKSTYIWASRAYPGRPVVRWDSCDPLWHSTDNTLSYTPFISVSPYLLT
jgi:hypothetical protein